MPTQTGLQILSTELLAPRFPLSVSRQMARRRTNIDLKNITLSNYLLLLECFSIHRVKLQKETTSYL